LMIEASLKQLFWEVQLANKKKSWFGAVLRNSLDTLANSCYDC
jgi:hypothetical protein